MCRLSKSKYSIGTYVEVIRDGIYNNCYFKGDVLRITETNVEMMVMYMDGTSTPQRSEFVTKKHLCKGEIIKSSNGDWGRWFILRKKDLKVLESYDNVVGKELSKEVAIE